ncbi:MAG: flagellar protein FliT [Pseudogulbenkiania sp.]|nr:flagellar protein FliT [Pseudogulbenkiania sp.]
MLQAMADGRIDAAIELGEQILALQTQLEPLGSLPPQLQQQAAPLLLEIARMVEEIRPKLSAERDDLANYLAQFRNEDRLRSAYGE